MSSDNRSANSRIAKNTILLYIRMLAVLGISLYTSRIVLQNLGVSDYGIFNVVGGIATMFMFLNTAMNSATQRYLSIELGKQNGSDLQRVFNVALIIHVLIGIVIVLICEVVGLWFIYNKMVMPVGRETAVLWTFQFSLIACLATIVTVPYNALLISREKMSVFAYLSVLDVIIKLLVAFVIVYISFDRLIIYGLLIALSQSFVRGLYFLYCKRKFVECKLKVYRKDSLYKEMTIFASWDLLGHFSVIINTSIQDMLLNTFFSPIANAARGIAKQVSSGVTGFNNSFQLSVEPQITKSYSAGNRDRMLSLVYNSSRFSVYLLWLLSFPIILCVDNILNIWLIEVPKHTSLFIQLVLINNMINSTANPLNIAIRAKGQIKYPSLYCGLLLCLNLPLSYVVLRLGYGAESVFIVMIFCSILCQICRIYYMKKMLDMPLFFYIKEVIFKPVVVLLLTAIGPLWIYQYLISANDFITIINVGFVTTTSVLVIVYFIGLKANERKKIINTLKKKINK